MAYCSKQDLVDRFGERELIQLTDRNTPATVADDTVITRALADAASLIDGYVGKVHKLPIAPVPEILVKLSADIARYYLHGKGVAKDHPVRIAYDDAISYLVNVSRGLVQLVETATGEAPEAAGGGSVKASAPDRVFTRDSLRGF